MFVDTRFPSIVQLYVLKMSNLINYLIVFLFYRLSVDRLKPIVQGDILTILKAIQVSGKPFSERVLQSVYSNLAVGPAATWGRPE